MAGLSASGGRARKPQLPVRSARHRRRGAGHRGTEHLRPRGRGLRRRQPGGGHQVRSLRRGRGREHVRLPERAGHGRQPADRARVACGHRPGQSGAHGALQAHPGPGLPAAGSCVDERQPEGTGHRRRPGSHRRTPRRAPARRRQALRPGIGTRPPPTRSLRTLLITRRRSSPARPPPRVPWRGELPAVSQVRGSASTDDCRPGPGCRDRSRRRQREDRAGRRCGPGRGLRRVAPGERLRRRSSVVGRDPEARPDRDGPCRTRRTGGCGVARWPGAPAPCPRPRARLSEANETTTIEDMATTAVAVGTGSLLSKSSYHAMTDPNLLGFGHPDPICAPSCLTQIDAYNFGLGVVRAEPWIFQDPELSGFSATEAYLPAEKISVSVAVTYLPAAFDYLPAAFDAQGNYANSADALFRSIGGVVAPKDPPPTVPAG